MDYTEQKLLRINRNIRMGYVRYSLVRASLVTAVAAAIEWEYGNIVGWGLYYAWAIFAISYGFCVWLHDGLRDKAGKISRYVKDVPVAQEVRPSKLDYGLAVLIFVVLLSPPLARLGMKCWLEWNPDSLITVHTNGDEAENATLRIPAQYFYKDRATAYWRGVFGNVADEVSLLTLHNLQPVAMEDQDKYQLSEYDDFTPVTNYPELLEIRLLGSASVHMQRLQQLRPLGLSGDLSFLLDNAEQERKEQYGLSFESGGRYVYAAPVDAADKAIVVCQETCSVLTYINGIGITEIIFPKKSLNKWFDIRTEIGEFLLRFKHADKPV